MTHSVISKLALAAACGLCFLSAAYGDNLFGSQYSETKGDDSGMSGIEKFSDRDYKKANEIFAKQYQNDPSDPYATLNLADSYSAMGDREHAIPLYQKLAATGKNERPEYYDPKPKKDPTFNDMACYHLKELQVSDSNCS